MTTTANNESMKWLREIELLDSDLENVNINWDALSQNTQPQSITVIAPGEKSGSFIGSLLAKYPGKNISLLTSNDKTATLCRVLQSPYRSEIEGDSPENQEKKVQLERALTHKSSDRVQLFLKHMDRDLLQTATIKQLSIFLDILEAGLQQETTFVQFTDLKNNKVNAVRLDIGIRNFPLNVVSESIIAIFNRFKYQVLRFAGAEFQTWENQGQFSLCSIVVVHENNEAIEEGSKVWGKILKALKTLSFVDQGDSFVSLMQGNEPMSLNETNLIRAMANWAHIFLTKHNPYYYSLEYVSKIFIQNAAFNEYAIRYFRAKFDPRFRDERNLAMQKNQEECLKAIENCTDSVEKAILNEGINFLKNILKTNYFLVSKMALSFRLSPEVLNKKDYPETPFGIFYMVGRNFRAFQVRYRDIARGGVRVVLPRTLADRDNALAGLFDEVNGLASAQQLKNKDIPEGGSKCVIVVAPGGDRHGAVKAAVSSLLDLITQGSASALDPAILDYYQKDEIIYLGPDENLTDDLIVWIIQYALTRGYKYAYAFMSSKPDFGINHKTYGVTSEGVNVYLHNVLCYLNLETSPFRIKMTGGPDGDVAGNELKILHREYGEKARVVAIADGFGAAYDPEGLNWQELLRLVQNSKSIVEFDSNFLSKQTSSFVIKADSPQNIKIRDTLFCTAEAEIFIPAGGRPYTVKETNWMNFMLPDGKPSALAIVEGANIFFTKEARQHLVQRGIVVIKDSSANKAGVSCSSFEIIACLTITPEEFAQIKPIYVEQVLAIIRRNADLEAKLLFQEWTAHKNKTNLVQLSYEISAEINYGKDLLLSYLSTLSDQELGHEKYTALLMRHCPDILVAKYRERILERLPRVHKIAILSAYMASHLVYQKGLNVIKSMKPEHIIQQVH